MTSGLLRPRNTLFPDLTTALRLSGPSKVEDKLQNDAPGSHDPIVDHLMSSRTLKAIIWMFSLSLVAVALFVIVADPENRTTYLVYAVGPLAFWVPIMTCFALPCSRRMR